MKRLVLLLLVGFATSIWAQDTIRHGDPYYLFHPMPDTLNNVNGTDVFFTRGLALPLTFFVPETPMLIYGIAGTIQNRWVDDTNYHRTAVLFEKEGSIFQLTDSVQRRPSTAKHQLLYEGTNGSNGPYRQAVDIEEYYFDQPLWVTDTFFIGFHRLYHDSIKYGFDSSIPQMITYHVPPTQSVLLDITIFQNRSGSNGTPLEAMVLRCDAFTPLGIGQSPDYDNCRFPIIPYSVYGGCYPIVGFHCNKRPRKPQLLNIEATRISLTWSTSMDGIYEIAVCEGGEPVTSAFRHYRSSDRRIVVDSLIPEHAYSFWVREACIFSTASYDTLLWSPWSATSLDLTTRAQTGIYTVGDYDFTLTPNPVHDRATISSPEPIEEVRVVDMHGRQVEAPTLRFQGEAGGQVQLDVGGLPAGVYFVHIVANGGQQAACRRLIKY